MDFVEDLVVDKKDPLTYLIMDLDKRKLIEAAAGAPRIGTALKCWTSDWNADFIEGKGRGRVIFLHGKLFHYFARPSPLSFEGLRMK